MKKLLISISLIFTILTGFAAVTPSGGVWTLETADFHGDYTGAAAANGTIGILPWREPFSIRQVMLNHVFELNDRTGVNCAVKGINPFPMTMSVDGQSVGEGDVSNWSQSIDMRRAAHATAFTACAKAEVRYEVVALRNMTNAGLICVTVKALTDTKLSFSNKMDVPKTEYRAPQHKHKSFSAAGLQVDVLKTNAQTLYGRYDVAASSLFIPGDERFVYACVDDREATLSISLKAGEQASFTLAGAVCSTRDFSDPYSESERELIYILHESVPRTLAAHERLWRELWQGDIEIEGDEEAQRVVRFAIYNLYGSCRAGSRLSVPPMGLSSQGYNGHIFWDTELWMFPPMLLLNEGIARSMVDYRTDRLSAARTRAASMGYRGAMYPWESDDFGQEATPTWAITGQFEHHITADVAIACWNYYCVTGNKRWLMEEGWPVLRDAAEFWVSRAVRNADGSYSVEGVVGADEYAENVTDNAFTNGAAIVALRDAVKAAAVCGEEAPAQWAALADGLRILRDKDGVTLEHADYVGQKIKQADVNLLSYPLGVITDPAQRRRDLAYYDTKIDRVNGPAMSFSAFSVEYARLGDAAKAEEMFRRSYQPNMRPPFGVLAETPTSHNPYFTTGAGGMLQAVLNGFGGLEITDKGVVQLESVLPASWKKLTIKGVGPERKTYIIDGRTSASKRK